MNSGDSSHLYHDSHFAGEALEARERMKARWVNAREERKLVQQAHQLHRAKETCRKRACWEQDNVRRDLGVILARTPLFHSTLQDEKDKLIRRKRQTLQRTMSDASGSLSRRTRKGVTIDNSLRLLNRSAGNLPLQLPPPTKNGSVVTLDNSNRFSHLSGTLQTMHPSESLPDLSPEKTRFPPIATNNTGVEEPLVSLELETLHEDSVEQTDATDYPASSVQASTNNDAQDGHSVDGARSTQTTIPAHRLQSNSYNHQTATGSRAQHQSQPPKADAGFGETASDQLDDVMPFARSVRRGHKYRHPSQPPPAATQAHPHNAKLTQIAPSTTLPATFDLPEDSVCHGHNRGAELRRRCHHAVMAIVRVQTRKEQRLRAASESAGSLTLPPAAGPHGTGAARQYGFTGPSSKSIADLSRWMSMSTQDPAQSRSHPGSFNPRQDPSTGHVAQKQSWLSFSLPDLLKPK